jgi:transcriptional regulator with XRE-family HTH domain
VTKKSPDSNDKEVGRRIRTRRLICGMSQTTLAEHLGITFQQVQKYEKGTNRVGAGRLQRIAKILGVPVSSFFGIDAETPQSAAIQFLDNAYAVRLVQAFSKLEDAQLRKRFVEVLEACAELKSTNVANKRPRFRPAGSRS